MTFTPTHGRLTVLKVNALDISLATTNSTFSGTADVHDTTGYGLTNRTKTGGLIDGKFTAQGSYDIGTVTGTALAMEGREGVTQPLIRQVTGAGTGKPQEVFSGVLSKFEVSDPVDDIVKWSAEWDVTGPVVRTVQP